MSVFVEYPWLEMPVGIVALLLFVLLGHLITRKLLLRMVKRMATILPGDAGGVIVRHGVPARLTHVVPLQVLSIGVGYVPGIHAGVADLVQLLANSLTILVIALGVTALLNVANDLYQRRPDSTGKPIKGYLQMVKIVVYVVAGLLVIGTLLERDIFTLLAGLGAVMAVLLLIFQTTILSLVASVQVSSYDMVRVGDWIEMTSLHADGDVIDISLHTIKVRNWDKTITTIPTNRLLTDTFKNWRGMEEAGGRRIKRALMIDQTSVRFLDEAERERLREFFLIDDYLRGKADELEAWNSELEAYGRNPVNARRLTNLGTFRAYVAQFLEHHPDLNHDLTTMVRQRDPTPEGIPLEVYCFTTSTAWKIHEAVQSDIFDHLLAILPEYGLRVFQHPSGVDLRESLMPGRGKNGAR